MLDTPYFEIDATSPDYAGLIVGLLEEFDARDFRTVERLVEAVGRGGQTISGFPRVRPEECGRIMEAVRAAADRTRRWIRLGDLPLIQRFESVLEAFAVSEIRFYPDQLFWLRLMQAEMKFLQYDLAGMRNLLGFYVDHLCGAETDYGGLSELMWLDGQARIMAGEFDSIGDLFLGRARMLVRMRPRLAGEILVKFAPLIALGRGRNPSHGFLAYMVRLFAERIVRNRYRYVSNLRKKTGQLTGPIDEKIGGFFLSQLRLREIGRTKTDDDILVPRHQEVLVSRAVGGIGDLLMMTPGLRAFAARQKRPVKFATYKKFFPVFENNPHVELIDLGAEPIEILDYAGWANLTDCPAAQYESVHLSAIKHGRVELFARGMGVKFEELKKYGTKIQVELNGEQVAFRNQFLGGFRRPGVPLVGVQPYSREVYREHPDIGLFIANLATEYDVLVFHHISDGLPSGPHILTTAGLSLTQSFALLSSLDVMVSVDSAFMHAASAFDVPIVALFGPIDGAIRSLHIESDKVKVIQLKEQFPCSPCWRAEDEGCRVTGTTGTSPCMAAIPYSAVEAAVKEFLSRPKVH